MILGAGAVGSVVGAYLARAGQDVVLLGRGAHVERIRERGLRVLGVEDFLVRVEATADPSELDRADLLLLTTKTYDTKAALDALDFEVRTAASLQNGVAKDDLLAKRFGRGRILGALTVLGASRPEPGVVHFTYPGVTAFGELDGRRSERVDETVAAFRESGLRVQASDRIVDDEWTKFCQWTAACLVSCLTRLEWHRIWTTRPLADLFVRLLREAAAVARVRGHQVRSVPGLRVADFLEGPPEAAVERVLQHGARLAESGATEVKISMLQDLEAGRPLELDSIEYLVEEARRLGVETPALALGYQVVQGLVEARK